MLDGRLLGAFMGGGMPITSPDRGSPSLTEDPLPRPLPMTPSYLLTSYLSLKLLGLEPLFMNLSIGS